MNKWQQVHSKLLEAKSELETRQYVNWILALMISVLIMLVEDKLNGAGE